MPQLVSTDTWFPFDYIRRNPDANCIEHLLSFDPQCHFDMIAAQLLWAKTSIDYFINLGKVFDAAVSKSPTTVRQAIVYHWLKAVATAVAATEEYRTHFMAGIARLMGRTNVLMSSEEVLAHHSLLEKNQSAKGKLWIEFRMEMNPLACKVDDVCLDRKFLLDNPKLTPENAFSPGTILRLNGIPAEQKRSFFLEAVELWRQVQNSPNNPSIPKFGDAAARLLRVTEKFSKTASYHTEAEATAAQAAAANPQNPIPATEPGYGLEDQANDAAGGAEIEVKPQSLSAVNSDQDGHAIQPESPDTVMGDDDGHAPIGHLLDLSSMDSGLDEDSAV